MKICHFTHTVGLSDEIYTYRCFYRMFIKYERVVNLDLKKTLQEL